jgi:hypothetical protein
MKLHTKLSIFLTLCFLTSNTYAQVLNEAMLISKIPLNKKPTSKPMSIAYDPNNNHYLIADGGLAPMPGDNDSLFSKSEIHVYSNDGKYIHSSKPGFDNRSIYFNPITQHIETVTYNISSNAGFSPNTGIFSLDMDKEGKLTGESHDVCGFNEAFGDASTIPSFDAETKLYFAKQPRSNEVFIVDMNKTEKVGDIHLDLKAANVQSDDITDYYVAFTGLQGQELAVLDVDHKTVLVFNRAGQFIAKSNLPSSLKLRAQNHIAGLGYANHQFFVYHEPEGEFGIFYGFKIFQ